MLKHNLLVYGGYNEFFVLKSTFRRALNNGILTKNPKTYEFLLSIGSSIFLTFGRINPQNLI